MSEVLERAFDSAEKSHWKIKTLGEVCRTSSGGTPSRSRPDFFNGNIPWVKSGELTDGLVSEVSEFISEEALAGSSAKLLPVGTLLIAMYGATVGKLGVLARAAATNQAVCAIFPPPELDPKFLFWYLRRQRSNLIAKAVGGAQPNISQTILRDLELPIPPIGEQRKIVAEIEKQFSRLDEAVANLQSVKANLKRYKASVLKVAVEGRLVETEATLARREGRTYETGEQLLQRILEERRQGWNDRGSFKLPIGPETAELLDVPEGWTWASIDQLAAPGSRSITDGPFGSNLKSAHYVETGPRVIRLQNIKDGEFADAYAHITQEHFESLRKHEIFAGDLVIASLGESPPRACIIPASVGPAIVKADCIRFKPHTALALGYLNAVLNCQPTRARVKDVLHGIGRPRLSLGEIRAIALPIPPAAEQVRIVAEVDRHLSIIREVEAEVDANLQRAQSLRQATLAKAFSNN